MTEVQSPATEAEVARIKAGVHIMLATIEPNQAGKDSYRHSAELLQKAAARYEAASRLAKQPRPTVWNVLWRKPRSFLHGFKLALGFGVGLTDDDL
jgi:hypothetical protein